MIYQTYCRLDILLNSKEILNFFKKESKNKFCIKILIVLLNHRQQDQKICDRECHRFFY